MRRLGRALPSCTQLFQIQRTNVSLQGFGLQHGRKTHRAYYDTQPQELHHTTSRHMARRGNPLRRIAVSFPCAVPTGDDLGFGIFIMWSVVWNVLHACSPPTIRSSFKRCERVRLKGD